MKTLRILLLLLAVASLQLGCVSSRYKVARKSTPPPVALDLAAKGPPAEVTLHHVIALRGPGSWKRNAYWDEYVVSITNRDPAPVAIRAATLTDFQGQRTAAGDNPWLLEKSSRSAEQRFLATTGSAVKFGAGLAAATAPSVAVAAASVVGGVSSGAAALSVAVLPAYVAGTIYRNVAGRHRIEDEFARRRLELPLVIPPGETRRGSLFFRISPGPRELALELDRGPECVLTLEPLAGLHLDRSDR